MLVLKYIQKLKIAVQRKSSKFFQNYVASEETKLQSQALTLIFVKEQNLCFPDVVDYFDKFGSVFYQKMVC